MMKIFMLDTFSLCDIYKSILLPLQNYKLARLLITNFSDSFSMDLPRYDLNFDLVVLRLMEYEQGEQGELKGFLKRDDGRIVEEVSGGGLRV